MVTVTYRNLRFILLGAAASMAAASSLRRLAATCGLVLLTQVLTRTIWITVVALSTQPTTITVSADFQSAVSLNTLFIIKNLLETALFVRLPTGLTSSTCSNSDQSGCSDFNFLLVQYGIAVNYVGAGSGATWATNGYNNVQNNPLYIPRCGSFGSGGFNFQAASSSLWSGTTNSGTDAYHLDYYSSKVTPAFSNNRLYGFPVRCIAWRNLIIIKN